MPSEVLFFPSTMITLQNFATSRSRYLGSGRILRFGTSRRRGILFSLLLRALHAVLGAPLRAARLVGVGGASCAGGIERPADDVVADAGQVLHTTAADEHDGVLLQVVAFTGDIGDHLDPVREPHARDLAQRRVRLLRRRRVDAHADAALLRAFLESRRSRLRLDLAAALANQLVDRRHFSTKSGYLTHVGQPRDRGDRKITDGPPRVNRLCANSGGVVRTRAAHRSASRRGRCHGYAWSASPGRS